MSREISFYSPVRHLERSREISFYSPTQKRFLDSSCGLTRNDEEENLSGICERDVSGLKL